MEARWDGTARYWQAGVCALRIGVRGYAFWAAVSDHTQADGSGINKL